MAAQRRKRVLLAMTRASEESSVQASAVARAPPCAQGGRLVVVDGGVACVWDAGSSCVIKEPPKSVGSNLAQPDQPVRTASDPQRSR
eukprot:COSAG01_NODE_25400_length_746_cov_1.199382_2_plen_87_part_00